MDPRLIQNVRAARVHILITSLLGLVQAICLIIIAFALASIGTKLLDQHLSPLEQPRTLTVLVLALVVRLLAVWAQNRFAHRAATQTINQLRLQLISHAAQLNPRQLLDHGVEISALATKGLENLRPYLTAYVPQLVMAALITPISILVVFTQDLTSALIAVFTIPLIPIFMILIGLLTEGRSEKLLQDMRLLWAQTLDLVQGLPTLRALGREKGPEKTIANLGQRHYQSSMATLKYAFLSSMVLELLATISVALIAVSIGMRLVYAQIDLFPALVVLILAADIYLPLRQVGTQFHASADGLAALDETFAVLSLPEIQLGTQALEMNREFHVSVRNLSILGRNGYAPENLSFELVPGQITVLAGPNGSGKSTTVAALLGLLPPDTGEITYRIEGSEISVADLDQTSLWSQTLWLPQRPVFEPGSVRVILGGQELPDDELWKLLEVVQLTEVIRGLPQGLDSFIGRDGQGLSVGQRQRLALGAALLSPAPFIILDEPTAHLDYDTERSVIETISRFKHQNRMVLLVAHRDSLLTLADQVVQL